VYAKRRAAITAFVEPLILYWVLFLPSWSFPDPGSEVFAFSTYRELSRIFAYTIPSLALIWLLVLRSARPFAPLSGPWPRRRDLATALCVLPLLAGLGALVSLLGSLFPGAGAPEIGFPQGPLPVAVMILSCLSAAYLEETYFRFYLFRRFGEGGIGPVKAALVSSLLFALCHLYEGPLGSLNAFLAGLLLFYSFARSRSLHGIAWAHGGYNVFVYIMTAIAGGGAAV
jgi:membrane protease YdiL (CAAX protease family)